MTGRVWPEPLGMWSCQFCEGKDPGVSTWKRLLALHLICFLCSVQEKLDIRRIYISECKSKYYSCLIFEIIWVCEVGLRFLSLAGFSGHPVCWVQRSRCGWIPGLQGKSHSGRVFASGHFSHQPECPAHTARVYIPVLSLILFDLSPASHPQQQGESLLTRSSFLSFGRGD